MDKYHDAIVSADSGVVDIQIPKSVPNKSAIISEIEKKVGSYEGVKSVNIQVMEEITPRSLMYMSR